MGLRKKPHSNDTDIDKLRVLAEKQTAILIFKIEGDDLTRTANHLRGRSLPFGAFSRLRLFVNLNRRSSLQ